MSESARLIGLALGVLSLGANAKPAPAPRVQDEPAPNAPENCPYCMGDPELMHASGVISHGGFAFAKTDTHAVDALLPSSRIIWVETEHFELGLALAEPRVRSEERRKLAPEIAHLREALPAIDIKPRALDVWLRSHLYARRVERIWDRFVEIMHIDPTVFPSGPRFWHPSQPYYGEGPYLGQRGKLEVFVAPNQMAQLTLLKDQFGMSIRTSQRVTVVASDSLFVAMNEEEEGLRVDAALSGHIAFNLAINMLNSYKHYSYDTPVWLNEGLAHFMQREIHPQLNSFDSTEGFASEVNRREDWTTPVKRMIRRERAPRLAQLATKTSYSQLDLYDHFTTWSMTKFLIERHAQGYACLNEHLHGVRDEKGSPDGGNMRDRHRRAFQECVGISYAYFDEAWQEWALSQRVSR